jgi:hypothetical protein
VAVFPLPARSSHGGGVAGARGIIVSHETVRQWARKFGQHFPNHIRRRLPRAGDKWHLGEVALKISGVKHWLWRAVDETGMAIDVLVQRRRDKQAAKRLLRKLLNLTTPRHDFTAWNFEEIRRTIGYACEVPVELDARLGERAKRHCQVEAL